MNTNRVSLHFLITSASLLLGLYALSAHADAFSDYVSACKSQLGFSSIPRFACNNIQFREATSGTYLGLDFSQSDDFVAHQRINSAVDAVFACRWVGKNGRSDRAEGGELIVHNRSTGGTCFFELKDTLENSAYPQVPLNPVSPTSSTAANTWRANNNGCTGCHAAGPYIASPQIVNALASFGLINDGHDTFNQKYYAVNGSVPVASHPSCSAACHVVGGTPPVDSEIGAGLVFGAVVMPSINHVINDITAQGIMPPAIDPYSDYRWMNHDRASGTGDWELLKDEASQFKGIYNTCQNPTVLQAHVVDSGDIITTDIPDNLHTFNLRDGLECRNNQQSSGLCHDWKLRYMCNGAWTDWINNDSPSKNGDYERRTDPGYKNLCASPTEMQAETDVESWGIIGQAGFPPISLYGPSFNTVIFTAPNDRLEAFDPSYGLACIASNQPDGKCSDYVVRFICE